MRFKLFDLRIIFAWIVFVLLLSDKVLAIDIEENYQEVKHVLSLAKARAQEADLHYQRKFAGRLRDARGRPKPMENLNKVIVGQQERIHRLQEKMSTAYQQVNEGRITSENFLLQSDEAVLEVVIGSWAIDRDEARLTIELLQQNHRGKMETLRRRLNSSGAGAKEAVSRQEKEQTQKTLTCFKQLAANFARQRLQHVATVKAWASRFHPNEHGRLPMHFAELLDAHFAIGDNEDSFMAMPSTFQVFINENELILSGVIHQLKPRSLAEEMAALDLEAQQGKTITIASLEISYTDWRVKHGSLMSDLARASQELLSNERDLSKGMEALEEIRANLQEIGEKMGEKKREIQKAGRTDGVPEDIKTREYKTAEKKLRETRLRLERLEGEVGARSHSPESDSRRYSLRQLEPLLRDTEKKKERLQRELDKAGEAFNARALKEQHLKHLDGLEYEYRRQSKQLYNKQKDLDFAERCIADAEKACLKSEERVGRLQRSLRLMGEEDSPLITEVTHAGGNYLTQVWLPDRLIRDLRKALRLAKNFLEEIDGERKTLKKKMLAQGEVVSQKSLEYVSAIYKSAAGQAYVELAFTGLDIAKAASKGASMGPYGAIAMAIAETVKKVVDAAIFGFPKFAEPEIAKPNTYDVFADMVRELGECGRKQAHKIVISQATKAAVTAVLHDRNAAVLNELLLKESIMRFGREITLGSTNAAPATLSPSELLRGQITRQREICKKSRETLNKAIGKAGKGPVLRGAVKEFLLGLFKEFAKSKAKQAIANFFEGKAMKNYILAQLELKAAVCMFREKSGQYWKNYDQLQYLQAIIGELVDGYAPDNQMKVFTNRPTSLDTPYVLKLTRTGHDAHASGGLKVKVILGGVTLSQEDTKLLVFKLPQDQAHTVITNEAGAAVLQVKVLE